MAWHRQERLLLAPIAAWACAPPLPCRHRELAAAGRPLELSRASLCDLLNAQAALALM